MREVKGHHNKSEMLNQTQVCCQVAANMDIEHETTPFLVGSN